MKVIIRVIALFLLFSVSCSSRIDKLGQAVADLRADLDNQKQLLSSLVGNVTINKITEHGDYYIISLSCGINIVFHKDIIPLINIGITGNWMINGRDTGINALMLDYLTPTIEIVDGFWYINSVNTGIRAEAIDGNDYVDGISALNIISIIEGLEEWTLNFTDGTSLAVPKTAIDADVENNVVKQFLSEVQYDNADYSYSCIKAYRYFTSYRKDQPRKIRVDWPKYAGDVVKRTLLVTDNEFVRFVKELPLDVYHYDLTNLIPGKTYCVKIKEELKDTTSRVIVSKKLIPKGRLRMLAVDGYRVENFRDMGGWETKDGASIVFGKLIRGAEVLRQDESPIQVSQDGVLTLIEELGVDVEIDFGDFSSESPLAETSIEFIHGWNYQITAYRKGLDNQEIRRRYANCLRLIISRLEEGKTIYFHCNAGADRTGTIAFLLEGLWGVSESDISKDYELTTFAEEIGALRYRNNEDYQDMISFIKDNYSGTDLNEKIYDFTTTPLESGGLGLVDDEVKQLRRIMVK